MIKKLIALSILISFNAAAVSQYEADTVCSSIERESIMYSVYGSVGLKSVVKVINDDTTVPKGLSNIMIDAYNKGNKIGTGLNAKQKDLIGKTANAKCMAYFGY